jgi:hypothetical protein
VASASRKPTLNAFARWHGIILESVQAIPGEWRSRGGGARGNHDPMIRAGGRRRSSLCGSWSSSAASSSRRSAASGRVAPADFLRLVALGLAEGRRT